MSSKQSCRGNILYFQSGGPTCVINTTFLGLYDEYRRLGIKQDFLVSRYGISSLLEDNLTKVSGDYSRLLNMPGAFFGSLRKMLPDDKEDELAKLIIENLEKNNIRHLFVNGGNDSMDTANKIYGYAEYYGYQLSVIGLPKTIDNDLIGCDHTPGYPTAAKYVANSTIALTLDEYTYRKGKILIIETMGRDCGYVAASSALASLRSCKPDYIYVPEVEFSTSDFLAKAIKTYEEKGHCVIVVSEGIHDANGLIAAQGAVDSFGNKTVGGVGQYLRQKILEAGYPSRAVTLEALNRSSSFMLSKVDSDESRMIGKVALDASLSGESGKMVSIRRDSNDPYSASFPLIDLSLCSRKANTMPLEFLKGDDNIDDRFIDYAKPLIKGNIDTLASDGLLDF